MLLAALLSVAIYFMWQTATLGRAAGGFGLLCILTLMVVIIEKMINTTYTVTAESTLVIHTGRFSKDVVIPLTDIKQIDKTRRGYLLVVTTDNIEYAVHPTNEQDFIKCIEKRRSQS